MGWNGYSLKLNEWRESERLWRMEGKNTIRGDCCLSNYLKFHYLWILLEALSKPPHSFFSVLNPVRIMNFSAWPYPAGIYLLKVNNRNTRILIVNLVGRYLPATPQVTSSSVHSILFQCLNWKDPNGFQVNVNQIKCTE